MFDDTIQFNDFVKSINGVLYTSIPAKKAKNLKLKEGDIVEITLKKIRK